MVKEMPALFSLDVTGENFSEPVVSELSDDPFPEEEESSINVKDSFDSRLNVTDEEPKLIKISLASHIRDLTNINSSENPELYEVYRNLTMDIRKFIYNSIVSEDFCVNCRVINDNESDTVQTNTPKPSSETKNENFEDENMEDLDKKTGTMSDYQPFKNEVSQQASMSVDGFNEVMSFDMNDNIEKLTNSSLDGLSPLSSLESLSLDNSECGNNVNDNDSELNSNNKDSECILLELSPSKLNRTVLEMAHVLMRRFYASYPRAFRAATGNIAADVYALGKRYYISNDQGTDDIKLQESDKSHVLYLAHLYKRQRNICYFCGFVRCERSRSSKNSCQFLKCTRCLGYHRWSSKSCKSRTNMLDKFLQSNDWRTRRPNYWVSQPPAVKELLHCFYCNNDGEANFKCQGVSCPEGADTLWVRCLELLGTKRLKHERNVNPHLFPHLTHRNFVFDEKFKVSHRR